MCVGTQAFADDPGNVNAAGAPTATQSQTLKDCLAKQKATNSSMSTAEMTKACADAQKLPVEKDSVNSKDSQAVSPKP
jgi:hypothetical protein